MSRTYIITWAQNGTAVDKGFWSCLQTFRTTRKATLVVIPGRYKNPTSRWEAARLGEERWSAEVAPYLKHDRGVLCPNLRCYADIKVQPTASTPLSGFEVFLGKSSGIFGHPKRQLAVVPTSTRHPRIMVTTGACTVKNYSDSKAGKKGSAHHVIGAVVVEVEDDGTYFIRHVTKGRGDGSFIDLDTRYTPTGAEQAPPAESLTLGDWHSGRVRGPALAATRGLFECLRPKHLVLHDFLDFRSRNHHERSMRAAYENRDKQVATEVAHACTELEGLTRWGRGEHRVHVVRSNHDEAFERWLEEAQPRVDPVNAPYYHAVWARVYAEYNRTGSYPDVFELEYRGRGGVVKRGGDVHFLKRNESLKIAGVEHGFHSDKGPNGARGSLRAFSKLGCKVNIGHGHTPGWLDGAVMAGVMDVDHGYNGLPSSWLVAHIATHADGKRQVVICIRDRFRAVRATRRKAA